MGSAMSAMALDSTTLAILLVVALSSFGYMRGVSAEGITLAGIIGFTVGVLSLVAFLALASMVRARH